MRVKTSIKLLIIVLIASSIIYTLFTHVNNVYAEKSPELPLYYSFVKPNPSVNIGPGAPAVVHPGETFTVILKEQYSSVEINGGYIYTVKLEDNKIHVYNYSVVVERINNNQYNITIPIDTEPALYDLVLVGSDVLVIERSVWVIKGLNDILKIVHISDLHYGTGHPDEYAGARKRIGGLLLINMLKPDIVVHTGDDTDTASKPQYLESRALRYMLLYSYPVFLNPGNHDYPLDNFIEYYGVNTWARLIDGKILWIALDTDGDRGYIDWDQALWLTEVLEKYRNVTYKIIQFHHPIFYWQGELHLYYNHTLFYENPRNNPRSPLSYYWANNLSMARYFLKLCEDYNVTLVFAGHIHRDQYVLYHSTRTNTTTYFMTTTTFAHSTGTYNGFQYMELNIVNFTLNYPYAPPTFKGFMNYSKTMVYNSIRNHPPYWDVDFRFTKHAYVFDILNNLFNISTTILLALPWKGDFKGVYTIGDNPKVSLIDHIILNNILYIALKINITIGEKLTIIIYNQDDWYTPVIKFKESMPNPPQLGVVNKLYFDIFDDEWGLKQVYASIINGNQESRIEMSRVTDTTWLITLPIYTGDKPFSIILKITSIDYRNNSITVWFNITLYPQGQTPTTAPVKTISVESTINTPLETTITETSPAETPTETSPTVTTQPKSTTPQTETASTPSIKSSTPKSPITMEEKTGDYTMLIIVGIIIVIVLLGIIVLRKK